MSRYLSITDVAQPQLDADVHAPVRIWLVTGLAAMLGVLGGFIDFALTKLIHLITNACYAHTLSFAERSPAEIGVAGWVVLLTAGGGLLVGAMEKLGSRSIRGGGMGATQAAVLIRGSRIAGKIAFLKPLASAVAIGTGSPLGREGPTIQSTGAASNVFGSLFRLSEPERRVLLGAATAAGMAATYRTPVSAALLGVEVVLLEIRSRTFLPLMVAAAGAAAVSFVLAGPGMLVRVPVIHSFGVPGALPWYALFGLGCGLLAAGIVHGLAGAKWLFKRIVPSTLVRPAVAGLVFGAIGLALPAVLGSGYATDSHIFHGTLGTGMLGALAPLKLAVFVVAMGGAMSGGQFSPTLMASASLGSLFAHGVNLLSPGAGLNPAAFALAGAGAVFGAASRAPFTFAVLTFELARNNQALIPLILVNAIATAVAWLLVRDPLQAQRTRSESR